MNEIKIYSRYKKGDVPAAYNAITERIAGDTVYNERREISGAYIQSPDPDKSGYYNVSRLDKNQAAKLFSYYDSWGNTQDD